MSKFSVLKNISLIFALIVVVYLVGNYTGVVKSSVMQVLNIPGSSVQGISTKKAQEISEKLKSDVIWQAGVAQDQIINLTVGDAVEVLSRLQKIPQDFRLVEQYTKEKLNDMLKSKEK